MAHVTGVRQPVRARARWREEWRGREERGREREGGRERDLLLLISSKRWLVDTSHKGRRAGGFRV